MNITLTMKDADFILKYLREKLQNLNENFRLADEKEKEISRMFNENEDIKNNLIARLAMDSVKKEHVEFSEYHKAQSDILIKCIELLTIGSSIE